MGNAHGSVLAVADEVTSSNDEHGVAVVLERVAAAGRTPGSTGAGGAAGAAGTGR